METKLAAKSQRINLGSGNMKFSDDAMRKLNYVLGALFLISFALNFSSYLEEGSEFGKHFISACVYFIGSIVFILKDRLVHSPRSKYAPHFIISEKGIKIKRDFFNQSAFINWDDVKKVELGYYKIGIKDRTGLQFYPYTTRKETSIEIKREIESIATSKGIEVENLLKR